MGPRRIIVLLIAVIAAGGTAMYARSWVASQQTTTTAAAPATKQSIHEVLVAETALAAGIFVKPQHLRWQRWPTDDVPDSYVLRGKRNETDMVGAVVRSFIGAGEPITDGAVVKPGDRGFLAAVLNPGMRAVSVPINATSSNAGLIFPGDRIDLILTQTLTGNSDGTTHRVSETVLKNIRIIAMGAEIGDDPEAGKANEKAKTATFEVTPQQAESVTLLTELGKLSLSLRSLAGDQEADNSIPTRSDSMTWDKDVSHVLETGRVSSRLLVLRGSNTEDVQVQQGSK